MDLAGIASIISLAALAVTLMTLRGQRRLRAKVTHVDTTVDHVDATVCLMGKEAEAVVADRVEQCRQAGLRPRGEREWI